MAMMDYGALLRVDGVFVNKNKNLFIETSNTGYVCKEAEQKDGTKIQVDGNYFVYAGDKQFLAAFYKTGYLLISNEKIIASEWDMPFLSYTHHFPNGLPDFTVRHLDPKRYPMDFEKDEPKNWEEYVRENWQYATGKEPISELENGWKRYHSYLKYRKRIHRASRNGRGISSYTRRFLTEWDHAGHHYEVIFGYGIEPQEHVWKEIRDKSYGFTETEKEIIDRWFAER